MARLKHQINRQIEGKELPFVTVPDGIRYGEERVQRQREEQEQTRAKMAAEQSVSQPAVRFLDPEEVEKLNFNELLARYETPLQEGPQERLEGQRQERPGRGDKEIEAPERTAEDLERIEREAQRKSPRGAKSPLSQDRSKKEKEKEVTQEMTRKETVERGQRSGQVQQEERSEIRREDRRDEKDLTDKSLEEISRSERQAETRQERKEKGGLGKEITSRTQERVYLNDHDGKEIYQQIETARETKPGKDLAGRGRLGEALGARSAHSMNDLMANAKIEARANSMLQSAALITHSTGRVTEFQIGKDVLQFRKEEDTTFAYKNEEKVDRDEAVKMLKELNKDLGEKSAEKLNELTTAARANPYVQALGKEELAQAQAQRKEEKVLTRAERAELGK